MTLRDFCNDVFRKPFVVLGATVGLSGVVALLTFLAKRFMINKNAATIPALEDSEWIEIGRIKELYLYPLKSGKGKAIENCDFTDYGISVKTSGLFTLDDRMLLVYDSKTGKFQTGRNYPKLLLVSISAADENSLNIEADGMPKLVIRLPEKHKERSSNQVDCSMWWNEPLKCIDCGPEPAAWISKFLTGTSDSDLRFGSAISKRRNIFEGPWEKFTKVYTTLRNEDTGYFADLASYMLMTESSLHELNKRLENTVSILRFRPNIVVAGSMPFDEDSWEWIKIGENVLLRNVKPCPRCAMVRVDPETAIVDGQEPLKTLRTFREQKNPKRIEVDGKAPVMGIYCGLYHQGAVKIDDKVFVKRFAREKNIKTVLK
ncbi:mitochondrial amidoxime reducing component 2-like [Venturia canescens]|uniref:mitochondrial amidoxime reducing component 2-like n=1 Tax=Venturia canescens TaxID=32260 RepID=UPI001C9D2BB6|nr:mitochondrial amidoxime reducing component 2-like [Venturia canescens]